MLKHMCDARARAIDCFCIVGIWHILLGDVKSAARPPARPRPEGGQRTLRVKVSTPRPPRPTLPPGFTRACTANVAFGRRAAAAAAAFKSPPRAISPFSFNIPNNPSIHPSSRRRPTSITSRIFPSQLLCFPRLRARRADVSISTQNQSPRDFIRSVPSPSLLVLSRR